MWWDVDGLRAVVNSERSRFALYLVATIGLDKRPMHRGTALNNERLHVVLIQLREQLVDGLMPMQHQSALVFAPPMARVEFRMFALVSGFAHQYGVAFGPTLMPNHLGEWRRDGQRLQLMVDKDVSCLCPFQDNVGAMVALIHHKRAIKRQTRLLEHPNNNLDARLS